MRVAQFASLAWCVAAAMAVPAAIDPEKAAPDSSGKEPLPDHLTMDTFDSFTSEKLTFVEFFSPFCSHCKQLAPKWEQAFRDTKDDQEQLGIHMRQVDCVVSGDLCEREGVAFYPNLRLYMPEVDGEGNKVEGKSKFVDSFPRALERTPKNFKTYMVNMVAEYSSGGVALPSSSEKIDVDLGMKIVAGEMEDPYFITMFSSKDEDWESGKFGPSCKDCAEHKHQWDKLSNLVVRASKTGHINCLTHPALCEQLGNLQLTKPDAWHSPRYAMFVPKAAGLIRFDYKDEVTVAAMKQFVMKLSENSKYEEVTARDLEDYGYLRTEIPTEPESPYYPLSNKVALVFLYDKKQISPEDKAIMPHLLEMVTKSPFNINLFASKSNKFEELLQNQARGLLEFVNSDKNFEKKGFDKQMHLATTLTARPTLYIFKENSMIPAIYQNFAIEDMRKEEKIQDFVNKNQFPLYGELTPSLMEHYFTDKRSKNKKNTKVVVTFLDTTDATKIKDTLFNVSMVAHQYNILKKEYYFKDLLERRDEKRERTAKLKAQNADTVAVINEMRVEIPHLFDHDDVLFTYVDMELYPKFAQEAGWDINNRGYKAGESIVVSQSRDFYWDSTLSGDRLTSSPDELRPVLQYLLDPQLVGETSVKKFTKKLANSPFHPSLRIADNIHRHGFFGYLLFSVLLFGLYVVFRSVLRKRAALGPRRGIIGETKSD